MKYNDISQTENMKLMPFSSPKTFNGQLSDYVKATITMQNFTISEFSSPIYATKKANYPIASRPSHDPQHKVVGNHLLFTRYWALISCYHGIELAACTLQPCSYEHSITWLVDHTHHHAFCHLPPWPITTHLQTPEGWKAELASLADPQRSVYSHSGYLSRYWSGAGQEKFAIRRPLCYAAKLYMYCLLYTSPSPRD